MEPYLHGSRRHAKLLRERLTFLKTWKRIIVCQAETRRRCEQMAGWRADEGCRCEVRADALRASVPKFCSSTSSCWREILQRLNFGTFGSRSSLSDTPFSSDCTAKAPEAIYFQLPDPKSSSRPSSKPRIALSVASKAVFGKHRKRAITGRRVSRSTRFDSDAIEVLGGRWDVGANSCVP